MDETIQPTLPEVALPPQPVAPATDTVLQRLDGVMAAVDAAVKQIGFLPGQIRALGTKVEGLSASISDSRLRSLLLGVVSVYDLADHMFRNVDTAGTDHRNNYEVIRTQLMQLLASNGLEEIPTTDGFDPKMHRAVQAVPCSDPAQVNRVMSVVRAGFRTDQAVLRYAEVVVGQAESTSPQTS
jgi:hypothetical protein